MSSYDDESLRELIALGAVNALDAAEQAELELALRDRPDLQAEAADLRAAAATLADATVTDPPPALRDRVLAALDGEPQATRPDAPGDTATPMAAAVVDPVVPLRRPLATRRRWLVPLVSAAAAAALAIGVTVSIIRDGEAPHDPIAAVIEDPDVLLMRFDGEASNLTLAFSAAAGAAVISGSDIEPPHDDHVYELWRIADGVPEPVEIFRPDGHGTVSVLLEGVAHPTDAIFAITIEPPGGSDAPTGEIIGQASV